jgi:pimeloyl-ACP methyl ester carboxylesterase
MTHLRLASELARLDIDETVLPADHHIVVDGLRLHYLDWGRRAHPPLLFLHGGRLTAHAWDLVCLALRTDNHCLAVDQRGHGDSEWSPIVDYTTDAYVRDIRGLIEQLALDRPVLIGQSLGGLNALTYAAHAADQLTAVIVIEVAPKIQTKGTKRITSFVADPGPGSLEDFVGRAIAADPRRDPRLLRYSLRHNLRQLPDHTWTWKYDPRRLTPEHFASITRSLEQLCDHTQTITCPVLVIRGAESDVLSDAQAADFAATLPDGRWAKVEAAGHNVQSDNPRALVEVITNFVGRRGVGTT